MSNAKVMRVFAVVVLLPTGKRAFEVNAPDDARACAGVEMALRSQGLAGPFDMVVTGSRGLRDLPRWTRRAS
ncbi:hypothetical protein HpMS107_51510 [Helicobacter pylori]